MAEQLFKTRFDFLTAREKLIVNKRIAKEGKYINYETILTKRELDRIQKRQNKNTCTKYTSLLFEKKFDILRSLGYEAELNDKIIRVEKDGTYTLVIRSLTRDELATLNFYIVLSGQRCSEYGKLKGWDKLTNAEIIDMEKDRQEQAVIIDGIPYFGDTKNINKELVDKIMALSKNKNNL